MFLILYNKVYHHLKVTRLKFDDHKLKHKAIIGYTANQNLNEALIFCGHWRWIANSPISGIRTPPRLLRFCLEQLGSTVIVIDEHRTVQFLFPKNDQRRLPVSANQSVSLFSYEFKKYTAKLNSGLVLDV